MSFKFPADEILFSIKLSVIDEKATKAYNEHKILEKKFLEIVNESGIPDSNITYSLMEMKKERPNRKGKRLVRSSQNVHIKLVDMRQYEPLQVNLLSNGFEDFYAIFSSSKKTAARKSAMVKAIEQAKTDAALIAEKLGKSVGDILQITTTGVPEFKVRAEQVRVDYLRVEGQSFLQIPQMVQSNINVTVKFELVDK